MMTDDFDDIFGDEQPAPQRQSEFVPPAQQTALGQKYDQFFVKAFVTDGTKKPFCEDYRDINKACSRASYLHFKEDWGTRVIAVNTKTGIAAELRWAGKDTGYAEFTG